MLGARHIYVVFGALAKGRLVELHHNAVITHRVGSGCGHNSSRAAIVVSGGGGNGDFRRRCPYSALSDFNNVGCVGCSGIRTSSLRTRRDEGLLNNKPPLLAFNHVFAADAFASGYRAGRRGTVTVKSDDKTSSTDVGSITGG